MKTFNITEKKTPVLILIISYAIVLLIIGIGFIFGHGYNVYDNGRAAAIHSPRSWEEEFGSEQLEEMFDGCIDKYEGWYGLSWKNTYSLYVDHSGLNREQFESLCGTDSGFPDDYTSWSEREYVEFISDYSVYSGWAFDRDYVWIILDNKVVFVEFGPTNAVDDYEGIVPRIIHRCLALLLLPHLCFFIVIIINNYIKKKNVDILLLGLSCCVPIIGLVLGIVYRTKQGENKGTSNQYLLATLVSVVVVLLIVLCYFF